MTSKSGFVQADFSPTLLRVSAVALMLAIQTLPVRAETLTLLCEWEKGGSTTYSIDLDKKTVTAGGGGSCTWNIRGKEIVVPDCNPPGRAEISDAHIHWKTTSKDMDGAGGLHNSLVEGSINRLSGSINYSNNGKFGRSSFSGKCRRATQKF